MRVTEKVIRESITRLEKELKEVEFLIDGDFLGEIVRLRKDIYSRIDTVSQNEVAAAAKKEKELFALAKQQNEELMDLISRKVKLSFELRDLKSDLWIVTNP